MRKIRVTKQYLEDLAKLKRRYGNVKGLDRAISHLAAEQSPP